jgi:acyl dehydratase
MATLSDVAARAGVSVSAVSRVLSDAPSARVSEGTRQRIAHGTLILSVAVGMTAGDINPQAMSYGYDTIRFVKPVFIGDTITVTAEVIGLGDHRRSPESLGTLQELVTVTNQRDEVVLVLTHLYVINKRPGDHDRGDHQRAED